MRVLFRVLALCVVLFGWASLDAEAVQASAGCYICGGDSTCELQNQHINKCHQLCGVQSYPGACILDGPCPSETIWCYQESLAK